MFDVFDRLLDKITMYKLVFYELIFLLVVAMVLGFLGIITYSPWSILLSSLFLIAISYVTNKIFSYVFHAPTAFDSVYITALILALIIAPVRNIHDIPILFWAAVWSQASKYMFAIHKSHIFNPAAIAVVLTAFVIGDSANWWVGTSAMMPFVLITGLLIVKKIQREDMVFAFFITVIVISTLFAFARGTDVLQNIKIVIFSSSLLFFGFVMLTEPLTTPSTKNLQILYGAVVGLLFSPQIHIGSIYSTPELALVVGNALSFLMSPKNRLLLVLENKTQIGTDIIDFVFSSPKKLAFIPGQYMEWTLPHKGTDIRGNRRYFTLASSPTEQTIRLGVKFYKNGSSFKRSLAQLSSDQSIAAGALSGDFTLPSDLNQKLVFIAGGIGITPFRSMIKYLVDKKEKRDIILLYSNKFAHEIMYSDVFSEAFQGLGIRTVYTVTDTNSVPNNWQGRIGRFDTSAIAQEVPDFTERVFYLSGPHTMVTAFEKTLKEMHVPQSHIKKDFFPGFV